MCVGSITLAVRRNPFVTSDSKLVKRGIVSSCLLAALKIACHYNLQESLGGRVNDLPHGLPSFRFVGGGEKATKETRSNSLYSQDLS